MKSRYNRNIHWRKKFSISTPRIRCRSCGIGFQAAGVTEASAERCCSQVCLAKVGPWLPVHGPKNKPKNWKPPVEKSAYDQYQERQQKLEERAVAKRRKVPKARSGEWSYHNDPFFGSEAWQRLRYEVLATYGAICMCCRSSKGSMHVDHIKPRSKRPELALTFENLQVLCRECNKGKGNRDDIDYRPTAKKPVISKEAIAMLCDCCKPKFA
jgi:5-methylcytosine-specific restriction endonuclease McrA